MKYIERFIGAVMMAALVGWPTYVFAQIDINLAVMMAMFAGAMGGWLAVTGDQTRGRN
jgi:hypothetical protein